LQTKPSFPLVKILRGLHALAVGLLPLGLGLWYYLPLAPGHHPRVYFTYTSLLFYLSDGLVLAAVAAWAASWLLEPRPLWKNLPQPLTGLLASLVVLGAASPAWSAKPWLSAYAAAHLGLMFALYVSLVDLRGSWRAVQAGALVALLFQAAAGGWGVWTQSTGFLEPLGLKWPGNLSPGMREASVVELLDGRRWLRMYGTLPHPNLLAGMLLAWTGAAAALFLAGGRRRGWALAAAALGLAGLALTFSRSAWLGLLAGAALLVARRRSLPRARLLALAGAALVALGLVFFPLRSLLAARTGNLPVKSEIDSTVGRLWMSWEAIGIIQAHPWSGVGLGMFEQVLADELPGDFKVEPVHNLILLASAELGVLGGLLVLGIGLAILAAACQAQGVSGIVLSAVMAGLLVTGLLDHYAWTMPPGRALFGLCLGVWAGQLSGSWRAVYAAGSSSWMARRSSSRKFSKESR
jgi:hypothetical protein